MPSIVLDKCTGLDTRPVWGADDFKLLVCSNLQIMPGGHLKTRPALIKIADVNAVSVGLYPRAGSLRCAIPSGPSAYATNTPAGFVYDRIGAPGNIDYTGKIGRVVAAETFGNDPIQGANGYLLIQRADTTRLEHHYVTAQATDLTAWASTQVNLPYVPGASLLKMANKILASDPINGYLRYCSSVNGPRDWTTAGDAGFEFVRQFATGSHDIVALGFHRGISPFQGSTPLVSILYQDAIQLWYVDTIPSNNKFRQYLQGPGTSYPQSCINVHGDIYWLGPNGFSNLVNESQTYEAKYADIGAAIRSYTDTIASSANVLGLWSQARSQMLWAVGTTVYVYNYYPLWNEASWSQWTFPFTVDAMCELNGVVYVRSGTAVYRLDDTQGSDFAGTAGATPIVWSWQIQPLGFESNTRNKVYKRISVQATGTATYTPIADNRVLTGNAITIQGSGLTIGATLFGRGKRLGLQANGSGLYQGIGIELFCDLAGSAV